MAQGVSTLARSSHDNDVISSPDSREVISAVRMLLYVYSKSQTKLQVDSKVVLDQACHLITDVSCSMETSMLAGSVIVSVCVRDSSSDEHCVSIINSYLVSSSSSDLFRICLLHGILSSVSSLVLLGHVDNSEILFLFHLLPLVLDLCRKTTR